jgi:hypothetical protein
MSFSVFVVRGEKNLVMIYWKRSQVSILNTPLALRLIVIPKNLKGTVLS